MNASIGIFADPRGWYFQDLQRAATSKDLKLTALSIEQLSCEIVDGQTRVFAPVVSLPDSRRPLDTFDAVLIRTMPPGSLEQIILRMDMLAVAEAAGVLVLNPPKTMETAIDKFLTSARLAAAGIRTPDTVACQTLDTAIDAFHRWQDVVVKPLFGGEGRGIFRVNDSAVAERAFRMVLSLGGVLYLQPFLQAAGNDIGNSASTGGCDIRVFLLAQADFSHAEYLAMERRNPHDWRANVSLGGESRAIELDASLRDLAMQAAKAVGAPLAAVDILPAADGKNYVLEVNAVPGWKGLAAATGRDVAAEVLDWLLLQIQRRSS